MSSAAALGRLRTPLGSAPPQARQATDRRVAVGLRVIATVLGAYLVSRVALVVDATVLAAQHHTGVVSILAPWDAGYYIGIAVSGYPSHVPIVAYQGSTVAFFPLFPLLGRCLAAITGMPIVWGLVSISWLGGAAAALGAVLLVAPRYGSRRAMQAGVLLAVFPGSVVAGIVYADSLAVAFAIGALAAMDRRRLVLAGLLGAAGTASLSLMLVPLCAALLAAALVARRLSGLLAPVLAASGAAAYLGYLWAHTGSPYTWSRVERAGWMVHLSLPWRGVTAFGAYAFSAPGVTVVTSASVAVALVGLVALAVLRAPLAWLSLSVIVIAAVTFDGGAWIAPRFVFDAFPLVLAVGIALPRRAFWPGAVLSMSVLVYMLQAYSPPNRQFLNL